MSQLSAVWMLVGARLRAGHRRPAFFLFSCLVLALGAAVSFGAGPASAACTLASPTSWTDGNSNWNTGSNWSTGTVPNGAGTNVCITNGTLGTPTTVTFDTGFTANVDSLQVDPNNTLNMSLNSTLITNGSQIINGGNIVINAGSGFNTLLELDASTTLSGGGTVTLTSGFGNAIILQGVGGVTLTNADNTIQGTGLVGDGGLALNNQGIVDANVPGTGELEIDAGGGVTNTNLLEATSGGTLAIVTATVNNAGGTILAGSGSTVNLLAADIQGGTLTNAGGTLGVLTGNVGNLDGSTAAGAVTINGTFTSALNTELFLAGTINNLGTIQIDGGAGTNTITFLGTASATTVTLQGGGTVNVSTPVGGGDAFIEESVGGVTLLNVNNTIQGEGILGNNGLTVTNEAGGVIDANSTGGPGLITTLTLDGGGLVTNAGLLEATNSGDLVLDNTVDNAGGNITANGAGATVSIQTTIQGGTLTNNGGFLGTPVNQTATLDGGTAGPITLNGTYTADFGSTTTLLGTINNDNTFQINGGSGVNTIVELGSGTQLTLTLQGGGTVNLSSTMGGGDAFIEQAVGGVTLANVNNTIQGEGILGNNGLTVLNEAGGVIDANSTGGPLITALTLDGGGLVTNAGLLEATNSGNLLIETNVDNAGANITANGAGATVTLQSGTIIQGGTLNNNGGTLGVPVGQSATLDGGTAGPITLNGTFTSALSSTTTLLGTINNDNTFQINGGSGVNTIVLLGNGSQLTLTLQGGGTVNLSSATGGGAAFIEQSAGGMTLVNVNNTIQGEGILGNNGLAVTNEAGGVIDANSTGGGLTTTLTMDGGGLVTNAGLLEATNSGNLVIENHVNNLGGNITANGAGATVSIQSGATISGGTLNTLSGGTLGTPQGQSATLDGTSQGALTVSAGSTYTAALSSTTALFGTFDNLGNIQINAGSGVNTDVEINADTTLQGGAGYGDAVHGRRRRNPHHLPDGGRPDPDQRRQYHPGRGEYRRQRAVGGQRRRGDVACQRARADPAVQRRRHRNEQRDDAGERGEHDAAGRGDAARKLQRQHADGRHVHRERDHDSRRARCRSPRSAPRAGKW